VEAPGQLFSWYITSLPSKLKGILFLSLPIAVHGHIAPKIVGSQIYNAEAPTWQAKWCDICAFEQIALFRSCCTQITEAPYRFNYACNTARTWRCAIVKPTGRQR
jgi:hypothetical protein